MIYIITVLFFISCSLFLYVALKYIFRNKITIKTRLSQINISNEDKILLDDRERLPLKTRVLTPIYTKVNDTIKKITPKGMQYETHKQLQLADHPYGLSVTGWIIFKIFFNIIIPVCFLFILFPSNMNIASKIVLFIVFSFICLIFPKTVLKGRINMRKRKLQNQLPDILDMLTVSVEAGLSFEGAISKVVKINTCELSEEFSKALQEMHLGKTRKQALLDMSERCDISELKIFISTLIQAELLGMSIANVLRAQSDQMRVLRRLRAQERALKAPVKILIPLILFIFPSIFVVVLGPAVIQIIEFFANM